MPPTLDAILCKSLIAVSSQMKLDVGHMNLAELQHRFILMLLPALNTPQIGISIDLPEIPIEPQKYYKQRMKHTSFKQKWIAASLQIQPDPA